MSEKCIEWRKQKMAEPTQEKYEVDCVLCGKLTKTFFHTVGGNLCIVCHEKIKRRPEQEIKEMLKTFEGSYKLPYLPLEK